MYSKQHASGFTLIEVLISISILSFIVAVGTQFVIHSSQNEAYLRTQNRLKSESEKMVYNITKELNQNRLVLDNSPLGNAYLARVNLGSAPARIANSTLPTIRPTGSLAPEKACTNSPGNFFRANSIGNILFFSKHVERFDGGPISNSNYKRFIDIYRFRMYYLTSAPGTSGVRKIDAWNKTNARNAMRLMEWTSVAYADYTQLQNYLSALNTQLNSTAVSTVRAALAAEGINFAWNKTGTVLTGTGHNTFYSVTGGTGATLSVLDNHQITTFRSRDALLLNGSTTEESIYSIAYNGNSDTSSSTYFPIKMRVPKYYESVVPACDGALPASGTTPSTTTGFPGGFEVGIAGPGSGRMVMLNVSMVAKGGYKNLIEHNHSGIAYAKDL